MSQPKMTSQKPKPDDSAVASLSSDTYLPRSTPSMSNPPILARVTRRCRSTSRTFSTLGSPMRATIHQKRGAEASPHAHAHHGFPARPAERVEVGEREHVAALHVEHEVGRVDRVHARERV